MANEGDTLSALFEIVRANSEILKAHTEQYNTAIQEIRANNELYQQMNMRLDKIVNKIDELDTRVTVLDKKCDDMDIELDDTRRELNVIQQQLLKNHLVFKGIPEPESENDTTLAATITAVLDKIGIQLDPATFKVNRVGRKKTNSKGSRIIVFSTDVSGVTQRIITAKRKVVIKANEIVVNSAPIATDDSTIRIGEQLTPKPKELLEYAKQLKENGYKFIWIKDGKVFAKEKENERPVSIKSTEDVDRLTRKRGNSDNPISQHNNKRMRTRSQQQQQQNRMEWSTEMNGDM